MFAIPRLTTSRRAGVGWMLALVVAGCGVAQPPEAHATALPAFSTPQPGLLTACEKALTAGILMASPDDLKLAWLMAPEGRIDLVWPPGFGIRFGESAEVVSPDGTVVAAAGQTVALGGGFSADGRTFAACEVNGKDWSGL